MISLDRSPPASQTGKSALNKLQFNPPKADGELTTASANACFESTARTRIIKRIFQRKRTNDRGEDPYQTPAGEKRKKHQQAKIRSAQGGYPVGFAKQGTYPHRIVQSAQQALKE